MQIFNYDGLNDGLVSIMLAALPCWVVYFWLYCLLPATKLLKWSNKLDAILPSASKNSPTVRLHIAEPIPTKVGRWIVEGLKKKVNHLLLSHLT